MKLDLLDRVASLPAFPVFEASKEPSDQVELLTRHEDSQRQTPSFGIDDLPMPVFDGPIDPFMVALDKATPWPLTAADSATRARQWAERIVLRDLSRGRCMAQVQDYARALDLDFPAVLGRILSRLGTPEDDADSAERCAHPGEQFPQFSQAATHAHG